MKIRSTAVVVAVMLLSAFATTQVVAGAHEVGANAGVETADAALIGKTLVAARSRAHM